MDILEHFEFSQSSLQDYADCRRRFQLRYLQRIAWPAVQAEPVSENEEHIQRGERFHHLIQQYLLGIPEERLARMAAADKDDNLRRWWDNFSTSLPPQISGKKHVEVTLSAPLGSYRLRATYDLVLIQSGEKARIFDWKTSTHRPKRAWLHERLQTRVYPYLLVQAGETLNGGKPLQPEAVEMIYWFAEPGQDSEKISYSSEQYEADGQYILGLVNELSALRPDEFTLTDNERTCRFCVYRSLCDRGVRAGSLGEGDAEPDFEPGGTNASLSTTFDGLDFNLEQINEISF